MDMLNILNLGAGVQSTTVLLMSCRGELPKFDYAIFADTQWEPKAVYRHLRWLQVEAAKADIPIITVTFGDLRADALGWLEAHKAKSQRARMPMFLLAPDGRKGILKRQCTSEYKVIPIERFIKTEILGLDVRSRWPKEQVVRQWFGISADEARRCAAPVVWAKSKHTLGNDLWGETITEDRSTCKQIRWKSHVYPLCDQEFIGTERQSLGVQPMTRANCLTWLERNGYPRPPRSACIGCPFHSDAEWRQIKANPEEWADVVDFDRLIRDYDQSNAGGPEFDGLRSNCYLHDSRMPLDQVQFTDNDYPMFQCGDGICGV